MVGVESAGSRGHVSGRVRGWCQRVMSVDVATGSHVESSDTHTSHVVKKDLTWNKS